MGFKFQKPARRGGADQAVLTDHQKAYREREKREDERFNLAVDSEFWLCFCFRDADERARFAEMSRADSRFFAFGDVLRGEFESRIGARNVRQFKPRAPVGMPAPNPLEDEPHLESLEQQCLLEADLMLAAFESVDERDCYENVFDSAFHVTAVFRDRDDVERFLADFALLKHGDKYMDGSAILKELDG